MIFVCTLTRWVKLSNLSNPIRGHDVAIGFQLDLRQPNIAGAQLGAGFVALFAVSGPGVLHRGSGGIAEIFSNHLGP